jgi:predicted small integral membrane protein
MTLRAAKLLLVAAVAVYYTLVVLNNTTDYASNQQFVRHVMMMDSTFPENPAMWRAVNSRAMHEAFYAGIIAWEAATMLLCWWGAVRLARALRAQAAVFEAAKRLAIAGLTLSMLMWLLAFLSVGGEWFLMWQSETWNGQEAAFRMFTVVGIILLLLVQREAEERSRV